MGKIFNIAGPCNPGKHYMLPVLLGEERSFSRNDDDYRYVLDLGLLVEEPNGLLRPANPMYTETIGRYLTRDDQDDMKQSVPETPWVRDDGLDMQGLLLAFLFRGGKYAVEVKLKYNYEKNREKAYDQVCHYMDHLGESEGWLVVFDPDLGGDWDTKLSHEDINWSGKTVHLFRC